MGFRVKNADQKDSAVFLEDNGNGTVSLEHENGDTILVLGEGGILLCESVDIDGLAVDKSGRVKVIKE